jgi:hypothetical protein
MKRAASLQAMQRRFLAPLLLLLSVALAVVAPISASAHSVAKTTYTVTVKKLCESFGKHVSCKGGYHDFHGTITRYQVRYRSPLYHHHTVPFSGNGTSCTHVHLTYWIEGRDAWMRFDIESTGGTQKGVRGTRTQMGRVSSALNKKPFQIKYNANTSQRYVYINGSATCTTKDGKK